MRAAQPRKPRMFRRYAIERDEQGLPTRMIWLWDVSCEPVHYTVCPKCGSRRVVQGRACFDCWWQR